MRGLAKRKEGQYRFAAYALVDVEKLLRSL